MEISYLSRIPAIINSSTINHPDNGAIKNLKYLFLNLKIHNKERCRAGIRTPILAFKGRCPTVRRPGNNYTNLKNHVPTSSLSISQSRAFYKTYEMVKNLCDSISFSPLHPLFVRIRGVGRECNGRIYHDHRSSGVVVNETLQDKDYSRSLRALILMLCKIPTPASMTTKLDPPYETNGRVMPVIGTTPMFMPIWMKLCEKTSAANPIL